ncbi:MAG: EamA family transporter [Tepidisphaeraceae bacterium]
MLYASICIAILGLTVYQVAMKTSPHGVNPFGLLVLAYLLAAIVCAAIAPMWSRVDGSPMLPALTGRNLATAAFIAVSVTLIEVGYLLVYRAGWSISVAPAVAQAATLSLVAVIGFAAMGERVTVTRVLGLLLCVGGVTLITRKA